MKTLIIEDITQETAAAFQIIIAARRAQNGEFRNVKLWMPKSQCEVNIEAKTCICPEWLVERKIEQAGNDYDFDCDGLMMVGLEPSTAPSEEEREAAWNSFAQELAKRAAKKDAARARKAAKKTTAC